MVALCVAKGLLRGKQEGRKNSQEISTLVQVRHDGGPDEGATMDEVIVYFIHQCFTPKQLLKISP